MKGPSSYSQQRPSTESIVSYGGYTLILISAFLLVHIIIWTGRLSRVKSLGKGSPSPQPLFQTPTKALRKKHNTKPAFDHLKKFDDDELEVLRRAFASMLQKK